MGSLKIPKISTTNRSGLVLSASEIVYDIDAEKIFGGDGHTLGGFAVGKL